ncbi:hypothetical protein [Roseibium sediminis]|uniref:hypothetical protein n=1 Tax=Roseibium sediminis TaxID=1775174 RepID=UPI00123E3892|nr:hypothetical protein [Roseibium sediminis]
MQKLVDFLFLPLLGLGVGFLSFKVLYPSQSSEYSRPTKVVEASFKNVEAARPEQDSNKEESYKRRRATYTWLQDPFRWTSEVKYLQRVNCADYAMRQYANSLKSLSTAGFDQETGRLISGDGDVLSAYQWRHLQANTIPLQPLAYMKDEFVPENFKHVMKGIVRKKNWTTCKFNPPFGTDAISFD